MSTTEMQKSEASAVGVNLVMSTTLAARRGARTAPMRAHALPMRPGTHETSREGDEIDLPEPG